MLREDENQTDATAPDTTPTDEVETPTETPDTDGEDAGEDDPDADATSAFAKGVAEASDDPDDVPSLKDAPTEPAADANGKEDGEDEDAKNGAEDKPKDAAEPDEDAKKAQADTDAEVARFELKGKAEERFRQMAGTIRDQAQAIEQFEKVKEAAQGHDGDIDAFLAQAKRGQEWENAVLDSTATPEQFGSAMYVLKAMNSDDPKMMSAAFDALVPQIQDLGRKLGRDMPGLIDPLEGHQDLQNAVENGDMDRKYAVELAAQRANAERSSQRDARVNQQQEHQRAMRQAMTDVQALDAELSKDPDYARKLPYLQPAIDAIRDSLPPNQWAPAIARAYKQLPALPAVPERKEQKPPVGHVPLRPSGNSAGMKAQPKNASEAFRMGVESVRG